MMGLFSWLCSKKYSAAYIVAENWDDWRGKYIVKSMSFVLEILEQKYEYFLYFHLKIRSFIYFFLTVKSPGKLGVLLAEW